MRSRVDVMAAEGLAYGLLAAAVSFPATLLLAVVGQGLGGLVGGCSWIGVSTPIGRPVWALVNQPTLHFSSLPTATGYWWASYLLPVAIAVGALPLLPRARTLAAELFLLHAAWASAVVGVSWLPLLDPVDGHLGRWLALHRLPATALYGAPLIAAPAAFLVSMRLLGLLRMVRQHSGRGLRLATVAIHLVVPALVWVSMASLVRGEVPRPAAAAVCLPVGIAVLTAWWGYPSAFPHRLGELRTASFVRLVVALATVFCAVWYTGRPLPNGMAAGILWARPGLYNNIRPWIDATSIRPGLESGDRGSTAEPAETSL